MFHSKLAAAYLSPEEFDQSSLQKVIFYSLQSNGKGITTTGEHVDLLYMTLQSQIGI
jgi:isopenicillin N synthase-like dioxygenase